MACEGETHPVGPMLTANTFFGDIQTIRRKDRRAFRPRPPTPMYMLENSRVSNPPHMQSSSHPTLPSPRPSLYEKAHIPPTTTGAHPRTPHPATPRAHAAAPESSSSASSRTGSWVVMVYISPKPSSVLL